MKFPLFVNGAYRSQSPIADDEQTINWLPEQMESEGATTKVALYPSPGVSLFATVTESSGGRAAFSMDGRCFLVIGSKFVELLFDGTYTVRGSVSVGLSPATISSNGELGGELFITSGGSPGVGGKGYTYDLATNTLTETVASGCVMGGMSYGYFWYLDDTSVFHISDINDGLTWDPLQIGTRSISPDPTIALLVTSYGQTWLLGEQSTEVWYNAAVDPFPFVPDASGNIPYGIAAVFSVAEANEAVTWLATTRDGGYQVMSAQGLTPQRISDFALEYEFSTYTTVADAMGETYREAGHTFYVLTFPSENKTWVFDFSTGKWHRRGTWVSEVSEWREWRPTWHCFAFGKHLFCDRESGAIYEVSNEFAVDVEDRPLRRVRRSPTLTSDGNMVRFSKLEIALEVGLGTATGQGVNPTVTLRYSDDGGKMWSNELTATAGAMGRYQTRVTFWCLGQSRARTFEVSVTDPIAWRITDAYVLGRVTQPGMAA